MHAIEFQQAKTFGDVVFAPGVRYLVEDHNAAQFMIQGGARVNSRGFCPNLPDGDWNGKKILISRCGALGDLLMLTPSLRELKFRWPQSHVTVATFPRYRGILEGNPHVDAFLEYPLIEDETEPFSGFLWLEDAVETHPDARAMPIIDALARRFGFTELLDRSLVLDGIVPALEAFPRTGKKRVGIQTRASAAYKSYERESMDQVAMLLYTHGWEVFLFGNPGEINAPDMPGLVNVTRTAKTVRESAEIAATCDVILAPDSFFVHLAAALGLPCVALYGPFPANLYTAHYPKCRPIQGFGACSPCFHHPRGTHYPPDGPCWKSGRCDVLAKIKPQAVARKVEEVWEEFHRREKL